MTSQSRTPHPQYELVLSRLAGSPAHRDQLLQLLSAPETYWKSQTPVGMKPVEAFELSPAGEGFSKFVLAPAVRQREIETLLVVMAARMPGLSIEFRTTNSENVPAGLRLVLGKLEAAHIVDGALRWSKIPHHSSLIGSK